VNALRIEAEAFAAKSGTGLYDNGTIVGDWRSGNWTRYENVDFGSVGRTKVKIRVGVPPNFANQRAELRYDSPTGTLLASFAVPATTDWTDRQVFEVDLAVPVSGRRTFVFFFPSGEGLGHLDWFEF
jgi:hypothetical protein